MRERSSPNFETRPQWRSIGTRVLLAESHAQLLSDGVHFEQSTCYHALHGRDLPALRAPGRSQWH